MTNSTMPNNIYSKKYAVKSVPDLADVGVLPLDEVIAGFGSDLGQIQKIYEYHLQHKQVKPGFTSYQPLRQLNFKVTGT